MEMQEKVGTEDAKIIKDPESAKQGSKPSKEEEKPKQEEKATIQRQTENTIIENDEKTIAYEKPETNNASGYDSDEPYLKVEKSGDVANLIIRNETDASQKLIGYLHKCLRLVDDEQNKMLQSKFKSIIRALIAQ